MGVEAPREHLRFSFGWSSTMEDAEIAAAALKEAAGVPA
jgi:cysteine sulfinate desulfinase/cysteine desulfurase-like protein